MMLGHINFFIMRNDMAVSWYNRALRYLKAAGKETSQGDALYGINMIYWRDGPVDSGLVAGRRYLEFARNYHDRFREATALINIGMVYFDSFYHGDSGLYYHAEALKIAKTMRYEILAGIIYYNMGYNYAFNKKLSDKPDAMHTALYNLDLAASIARKINYNLLLSLVHEAIADIDLIEGHYGQAASTLDLADSFLQLCIRFPYEQPVTANFYSFGRIFDSYLILRTVTDINRSRYELAKKTGQFRDAVRYQQLYFESKDTLRAVQQGRQLELIMAESEAERTNQKIQTLAQEYELNRLKINQNRLVFAGIAAMVVIISLFLIIYFQRKRLKAEQKSILNEQRLLRAQMNPHFLFNSLASIQNYIINEDTDRASIYLSRFSQLVRNILDNSVEEYVSLEKEVETIRNYLELQKARYAGKFDYFIDIDTDIDTETVRVPPMLAQPFIENAIEHGIKYKEGLGNISICFKLEEGIIRFEVEDDGVGREMAREIEASKGARHRSMATSITIDRLATINKKLKKKIGMEIEDLKDETGAGIGTRVRFGIPVVVK
jgi:hypothetical protein